MGFVRSLLSKGVVFNSGAFRVREGVIMFTHTCSCGIDTVSANLIGPLLKKSPYYLVF